MKKEKFTTTLPPKTIGKLKKIALHLNKNGNCNDVIESLVDKAWEETKNEMETENRNQ